MNHCMILPTPMLEQFGTMAPVDPGTPRMHLLLNHLIKDEEYHSYYLERREAGDYIIMDNGADEHPGGAGIGTVMLAAQRVRAQEIVLPDVQYESQETRARTLQALAWLSNYDGRVAYNRAGRPRVMVVPQGQTFQAWIMCAIDLIDSARVTMEQIEGPSIVVGVAKQYHSLFKSGSRGGGRLRLVEWLHEEINQHEDVHLLGYPRGAHDCLDIERKFPGFIRSTDSAKPAVYAMNGMDIHPRIGEELPDYPLRPNDFFFRHMTKQECFYLEHNIWGFTNGC